MMELNVDASNMIVGRFASFVAKQALLGSRVRVFNCEKLFLTGTKRFLIPYYRHMVHGRTQAFVGPYVSKLPDRYFRRVVKGMLPHGGSEDSRGRVALGKVECYVGVPERFKNAVLTVVGNCSILRSNAENVVPLRELLFAVGGKE